MSKDIWHFPSEAPVYCFQCVFYDRASNEYHFGQYSPVFKHFRSGNAEWEHEEVQRFAFAKDIIACLDELDRTRKALGIAKSKLNGIHRLYSKAFYTREDWLQVCMEMVDKANTALDKIKALEQKDK